MAMIQQMLTFGTDKDTLFMLSGVALMVFGAGLILSNPMVRNYLGQIGVGNLAQGALPDFDRYLKLRPCKWLQWDYGKINGTSTETSVRYVSDPEVAGLPCRRSRQDCCRLLAIVRRSPLRDFLGEAQVNPMTLPALRSITIHATSLRSRNVSDKDRREMERTMHQEVLESATFPEIIFECSGVNSSITATGSIR